MTDTHPTVALYHGDCLDILAGRSGEAEAVVCDPPSGIAFMGLRFDTDHGGADKWVEHMAPRFAAMREACIPGAYGLFWALPRTQDWTMRALRLAGWHIVDVLSHVFGQGWPKGRGQLKPAQEAWILCRDPRGKVRPLAIDACRVARGEPIAAHHGTARAMFGAGGGAPYQAGDAGKIVQTAGSWPTNLLLSHVRCCRQVGARKVRTGEAVRGNGAKAGMYSPKHPVGTPNATYGTDGAEAIPAYECLAVCSCGLASLSPAGGAPAPCACGEERWWACPVAMLDEQSGELQTDKHKPGREYGKGNQFMTRGEGVVKMPRGEWNPHPGGGGASRFYPCFHYDAKASRAERQAGCEGLLWVRDKLAPIGWRRVDQAEYDVAPPADRASGNVHSTIKPIGCGQDDGLMRWLVRLVTPEGGPVLDGMMGSGSTGVAAQIEGRDFVGCDIDPGAVDIARARIAFWTPERHRAAMKASPKVKPRAEAPATSPAKPAKRGKPANAAQTDLFAALGVKP